jgi:hypothetical protein
VVERGQDIFDTRIVEEGIDTGPESGKVKIFLQGMVKTIDADSPGLGKEFHAEIHLNGRVDFQQEKDMIALGDEIGAEWPVGIHPVINLPKPFIGVLSFCIAIKLPAEDLTDNGTIRCFVNGSY